LTLVKSIPEKTYGKNKFYKSRLTLKSMGQKNISMKKILQIPRRNFLRVKNYHSADKKFFVK